MKKVLATFHCLRNQFPQLPELASEAMFPTFLGLFRSFAQKLLNFLALGRARFRDTVLPKEANAGIFFVHFRKNSRRKKLKGFQV